MAEGEWGVGRLAEPEQIAARVEQLLAPGSLAGRRVLVTAGGTREPLDSVRFLGNRSSGRMGVALAEEARRRGAEVDPARREPLGRAAARCRGDPDADGRGDARRGARTARRRRGAARGRRRRLRARRGARRQASEGRPGLDGRARADEGHRAHARRAEARRARCSSRSAPSTARRGSSESAACSRRRTPISSSSTTSGEPTSVSTPRTTRSRSSAATRTHGAEGAQGRRRRRDSRRSREAAPVALGGAVVMAAGEGLRLRPLTERWPKPVLPIDGRPVVVTLVHELAAAGCAPIVVVTGHLAEQVEALLAPLPYDLRFVRQPPGSGLGRRGQAGPRRLRRTSSARQTPPTQPATSAAFAHAARGHDGAYRGSRLVPGPALVLGAPVARFLDPLPGKPPYELRDVFRKAVDAGADVSAIQVGRTRDLTSARRPGARELRATCDE